MEKLKDKNGVEIKVSDEVKLNGTVVTLNSPTGILIKIAGDDRELHAIKPGMLEVQPRMEKGMPDGMAKAMSDSDLPEGMMPDSSYNSQKAMEKINKREAGFREKHDRAKDMKD